MITLAGSTLHVRLAKMKNHTSADKINDDSCPVIALNPGYQSSRVKVSFHHIPGEPEMLPTCENSHHQDDIMDLNCSISTG